MDGTMHISMQDELIDDLTTELKGESTFDSSVLEQKVINAIREVKSARKYPSTYTDEQISADLYNYYSNARNIALYDYNKIGAEHEDSHNENGINRSYVKRETMFNGVIPIATF